MAQATSKVVSLNEQQQSDRQLGVGDSLWTIAMRRLRRDRLTMVALVILLILTVLSYSAPIFAGLMRADPDHVTGDQLLPPGTSGHILGTDDLGRDYFLRILYAGQISLGIAGVAGVLSLGIGIAIGVATGYVGGIVDDAIVWFITTLDSVPSLFLLLLVSSLFHPGPLTFILVLGLLGWTSTMRLVRGEALALREREFIVAARAIGASAWRTMFVHIVPNVFSIIIITMALNIGSLILIESALSFLGFGVKPPTSSWGWMLTDARNYYTKGVHMVIIPGLLISITVLCLYIIGDGLRDAFDPKLKEKA